MNINLTLIGQSISFILFVWFCMRYVWPPVISVLRERQQRITEGLDMAERGKSDLAAASARADKIMEDARAQSAEILEQADRQARQILQDARTNAQEEARRQQELASTEIEQERNRALEGLRSHLSRLVIEGAEKVLEKSIDADTHRETLEKLSRDL
jgi:F-type H+-transporting ATPase subunit b